MLAKLRYDYCFLTLMGENHMDFKDSYSSYNYAQHFHFINGSIISYQFFEGELFEKKKQHCIAK